MTTNEAPAAEDGHDEAPVQSITTPPPDVPPAVAIGLPGGTVAAGVPATITLFVDRGTTYRLQPPNTWLPIPMISYSELELTVPGVTQIRDHGSWVNNSSTPFSITFPTPGTYQISGCGRTGGGTEINAPGPRSLTVTAPDPPAFTWTTPADGSVVEVAPGGGQVSLNLSTGGNVIYPVTVAVTVDGVTTSGQHTAAGNYSRTVTLAAAPLGSRSITVKCSDPGGRSTTQTRTLVAHTTPTVTLDPYPNPQVLDSPDFRFILTGRTTGAGLTKVEWSAGGTTGPAENLGPNGDWSSWRASIPLSITGMIPFSVTVTDNRGATGSVSSSITLQLPPGGSGGGEGPVESPPVETS